MSTRQMGQYYRAQGGHGLSTRPGESLDLFGIQERRRSREAEHELDIQKRFAEFLADLNKRMDNDSTVKKKAEELGISVDEYKNKVMGSAIDKALKMNRNDSQLLDVDNENMKTPDAQKARNMGSNARNMGVNLSQLPKAEAGSIALTPPNVPGLGSFGQAIGSVNRTTAREEGGFPMKGPDGKITMVGGKPVVENIQTPPRFLSGQQAAPITTMPPNIMDPPPAPMLGLPGAQQQLNRTPSPSVGSPTLQGTQNKQQQETVNQSDITTTPPAFQPQWPPRSGLIPGARDILGNARQFYGDKYNELMPQIFGPLYKLLFGNQE